MAFSLCLLCLFVVFGYLLGWILFLLLLLPPPTVCVCFALYMFTQWSSRDFMFPTATLREANHNNKHSDLTTIPCWLALENSTYFSVFLNTFRNNTRGYCFQKMCFYRVLSLNNEIIKGGKKGMECEHSAKNRLEVWDTAEKALYSRLRRRKDNHKATQVSSRIKYNEQ